jgi:hypothetical protein
MSWCNASKAFNIDAVNIHHEVAWVACILAWTQVIWYGLWASADHRVILFYTLGMNCICDVKG